MLNHALLYHFIFAVSVIWPAIIICRRAGLNALWVISLFIPMFGLVVFSCALAFQPWPNKIMQETQI